MVNNQQAVVLTAAGLAVIALVVAVVILTSAHLETSGTIVTNNPNLTIFADAACTKQISTVQWGTLQPSGSATMALFIKNSGNMPLTLTLTENNWSPATAQNYLTLSWNQENIKIQPGASQTVTITINVNQCSA
jgi:hypothetical protein